MFVQRGLRGLSVGFAGVLLVLGIASVASGLWLWRLWSAHFLAGGGQVIILSQVGFSVAEYYVAGLIGVGGLLLGSGSFILWGQFARTQSPLRQTAIKFGKAFLVTGMIAAFLAPAVLIPAANATISSTPTAIVSAYSCEKGPSFLITVDNAVPPNYYAIATSGTASTPCGTLVYGGPNNAGGVTGTNITAVNQNAINNGGKIAYSAGTYAFTANTVQCVICMPSNTWIEGAGMTNTILSIPGQTLTNSPNAFQNKVITGAGKTGLTISNLEIAGNAGTTVTSQASVGTHITGAAGLFIDAHNLMIENVEALGMAGTDFLFSHNVGSLDPPYSVGVTVQDSVILSYAWACGSFGNVADAHFNHNYCSAGDTPVAVSSNSVNINSTYITDNTFDTYGYGGLQVPDLAPNSPVLSVGSAAASKNMTVIITGNTIETTVSSVLDISSVSGAFNNVIFSNNQVLGERTRFAVGSGLPYGVMVEKNTNGSILASGNTFQDVYSALLAESPITFKDNTILDTYCGAVYIAANYTTVTGNTIDHTDATGNHCGGNGYGGIILGGWSGAGGKNVRNELVSNNSIYDDKS